MRAQIVALLVLACANSGAANESPRAPLTVPPGGYKLPQPKLADDHDDHDHRPHFPLSLHLILGGEVGYVPDAHEVTRAVEIGAELELHVRALKVTAETSLVVNGKFQSSSTLAVMGVVHPRLALGAGAVVYAGIEKGIGQASFDGVLVGVLTMDVVVTPKVQTMCMVGPIAEEHDGHFGWGVGAACHVALLLAGEAHDVK